MSQISNDEQNKEEDILGHDEHTLEVNLRAALHRQDCPPTMVLGEYQLGLLAESQAARLKAHLDRCPYCQAELTQLTDFLITETTAPALMAEEAAWTQGDGFEWQYLPQAGRVIIRLVGEALDAAAHHLQQRWSPPSGRLAPGGVRGSQPLLEMTLSQGIDDFEAVISVATRLKDPTQCNITIKVNIPSRGGWPNLAGTEVILKREGTTIATQATNAFGQVVFKEITPAELTKLSFEITPGR